MPFDTFKQIVTAYRIDTDIVLVPHAQVKTRQFEDEALPVGPLITTTEAEDSIAIGQAIHEAFSHSVLLNEKPSSPLPYLEIVSSLHESNYVEFGKKADYVSITLKDDCYFLTPGKATAGGFGHIAKFNVIISSDSTAEVLGHALVNALNLSRSFNPFVIKYSNPNNAVYPSLSQPVKEQLNRLGAKLSIVKKADVIENYAVPDAIKEFFSYEFPATSYKTDEDNPYSFAIRDISFTGPDYLSEENVIADRANRFLVIFAYGDGAITFSVWI